MLNYASANTNECIIAEDMGSSFQVIVEANPIGLTVDAGFEQDVVSQRANWTDSGVFTSGDPYGFYFTIEGSWTPWYGNFQNKKDSRGNYYQLMAEKNQFCVLKTINSQSPVIGVRGEFDYITSSYSVVDNGSGGGYSKIFVESHKQQSCWLTTGEGLYIAFFGRSGAELPEIATHLKSAEVVCPTPYNTDKNGDKLLTLDECYAVGDETKKNMAYYAPYRSEYIVGYAECDSIYFHGNKTSGKIGINDCYEEVKQEDGTIAIYDRTRFVYDVPYLYKLKNKAVVGKNERVKFIIYDRYYRDNVGRYIINMYRGVSDMKDPGLMEKILRDLEDVFVGSRSDKGILEGGILSQFYEYIIKDAMFGWVVRIGVLLYITFLGLSFAMGSLEYKTKELMGILLKLTFVLSFTTVTSWKVYDYFIVRFFLDGFSSIIVMIANITNRMFDATASVVAVGGTLSSKFAFIDTLITFLFSNSITRKIQGLFFGVWFGFIVIPIFYILVIYYVYQLVNAIFPYIIMFIQAVLALALGPIFIAFYLFETTQHMFKNWLAFIGARFTNMAFLFLFLFAFATIIRQQFVNILHFRVCKIPLLQALGSGDGSISGVLNFFSFGVKVWDAVWTDSYPEPRFIGFCINLLFIYVLIYLFGLIMRKVPNIIDSMISIDGESGGGLKRGQSLFGGKAGWTFSEALDSSIKIRGKDGKDKGIYTKITDKIEGLAKRGISSATDGLWDNTAGALSRSVKNRFAGSKFKDAAGFANQRGLDAVNSATANYEARLGDGSESEVDKYRSKLEKELVKDPINNEFQRAGKDLEAMRRAGYKLNSDTIERLIKDRMNGFISREFGGDLSQYSPYIDNSSLLKTMKFGASDDAEKDISESEYLRILRQFKLQEAQSRLGLSGQDAFGYQKSIANKLNTGSFMAGKDRKSSAKDYLKGDKQSKERDALLRDRDAVLKEQTALMQLELSNNLKERSRILKEESDLLKKLHDERMGQEKSNIEKEIARMEKLKSSEAFKNAENKAAMDKYMSDLEMARKGKFNYDDLTRSADDLSARIKLSRIDQSLEALAIKNEYDRAFEASDGIRTFKAGSIEGNKNLLAEWRASESRYGVSAESQREIGKLNKSINDVRLEMLNDPNSLYNIETVAKADKDGALYNENNLRINDISSAEYARLEELNRQERANSEAIQNLINDAANMGVSTEVSGVINVEKDENKSMNLVLEGINNETFGVQGIKSLGLGEDNDDPLGFGKGAAAAILGADFKTADENVKVKDTNDLININRLRMAKQQHKILEFQLSQAKNSGDNKVVSEIEEQIKENNKQIRIIQDDVDAS